MSRMQKKGRRVSRVSWPFNYICIVFVLSGTLIVFIIRHAAGSVSLFAHLFNLKKTRWYMLHIHGAGSCLEKESMWNMSIKTWSKLAVLVCSGSVVKVIVAFRVGMLLHRPIKYCYSHIFCVGNQTPALTTSWGENANSTFVLLYWGNIHILIRRIRMQSWTVRGEWIQLKQYFVTFEF